MRDPKTHAKVLSLRVWKLWEAHGHLPDERPARINRLIERLRAAIEQHEDDTGWFYAMHGEPHWQHTEIIPDTKEEA